MFVLSCSKAKISNNRSLKEYNESLQLLNIGSELLNKHKYDDALIVFDKALILYPDFPIALNERGRVYLRKKDLKK